MTCRPNDSIIVHQSTAIDMLGSRKGTVDELALLFLLELEATPR
ncbi:hypothetical protein ES702_05454 [subsurface metagenome]